MRTARETRLVASFVVLSVAGAFGVIVGVREYTVGTDTLRYAHLFRVLQDLDLSEIVQWAINGNSDLGFFLLSKVLVTVGGVRGVFIGVALLLIFCLTWSARELVPSRYLLTILVALSMPVVHNFGVNIIRHGLAAGLCLVATTQLMKRRYIASAVLIVIAASMHGSTIIYVAAFVVAYIGPPLALVYVLCISVLLSLFGVGIHNIGALLGFDFVGILAGERFGSYLVSHVDHYRTGFRSDFLLYSLFPLVLRKVSHGSLYSRGDSLRPGSDLIVRLYLVLCSIFILSFHIPYSDRIGAYAWILIPFVVTMRNSQDPTTAGNHALGAIGVAALLAVNMYVVFS